MPPEAIDGVKAGEETVVARPAWLDSAPDAFKNDATFYAFTEPKQFYEKAGALLKAEKSMVVVPGENATPEERKAFNLKLGVPETPDKYEGIAKPADWPENVPYDAEGEKWFKDTAHKFGLTTAQTKGLFGDYLAMSAGKITGIMSDQQKAAEAAANTANENREKAIGELKKEWTGDAYAANLTLAQRAVEHFGGAALKEFFADKPELGDNIPLVKVFAAIGKALAEDTLKGGPGGPAKKTPGMQYETMGDFKDQK